MEVFVMSNKLQAKDLINLGLFTVLYFVIGCCVAIPVGFVYVPVTRDGAPGIKATIGVRPASRNGFSVNNLYLTKTDSGWMITGADVENPLALDEQKKP